MACIGDSMATSAMSCKKIAISHLRGEWWYSHLATSLAERVAVQSILPTEAAFPGFDPGTPLARLLTDRADSAFLGSICLLFPGISQLPIPTAVWTDFIPDNNSAEALPLRLFDQIFCTQKDSIDLLKNEGCSNVHWLPFAFDQTLPNHHDLEKIYDVAFVGSLDIPSTSAERRCVLGQIGQKHRMNDFRPVFGGEMMRVYNQSKIGVNIPSLGGLNMRTFEVMASGALLLTKEVGNGQRDLFKPGEHLVTYRDSADLLDKIDYFLKNDAERLGIAENARVEILSKHTYALRADEFLRVMDSRPSADGRCRDATIEAAALGRYYRYLVKRPDLLAGLARDAGLPWSQRLRFGMEAVGKLVQKMIIR